MKLPPGYAISWSGQYEAAQRVKQRLLLVVPLTLFLIFLLLYMNTRSIPKTMLIILAVPFSAVGAIWFLYLLGYNLSIAVWVGLIALLGVDAETGIFMLLYLDLAYAQAKAEGRLKSRPQLHDAIIDGAAKRIRPKFMTAATLFLGLIPIMWAIGAGADVMKRIAAPMIGGIFTSFLLELMVYPAIYEIWKWNFEVKKEVNAEVSSKGYGISPQASLGGTGKKSFEGRHFVICNKRGASFPRQRQGSLLVPNHGGDDRKMKACRILAGLRALALLAVVAGCLLALSACNPQANEAAAPAGLPQHGGHPGWHGLLCERAADTRHQAGTASQGRRDADVGAPGTGVGRAVLRPDPGHLSPGGYHSDRRRETQGGGVREFSHRRHH